MWANLKSEKEHIKKRGLNQRSRTETGSGDCEVRVGTVQTEEQTTQLKVRRLRKSFRSEKRSIGFIESKTIISTCYSDVQELWVYNEVLRRIQWAIRDKEESKWGYSAWLRKKDKNSKSNCTWVRNQLRQSHVIAV